MNEEIRLISDIKCIKEYSGELKDLDEFIESTLNGNSEEEIVDIFTNYFTKVVNGSLSFSNF